MTEGLGIWPSRFLDGSHGGDCSYSCDGNEKRINGRTIDCVPKSEAVAMIRVLAVSNCRKAKNEHDCERGEEQRYVSFHR